MSIKMQPDDPAYWMLFDDVTSTPVTHNDNCYICRDPEFAQMGLPLCYKCLICGAHVPADDITCDNGHEQPTDPWTEIEVRKQYNMEVPQWLYDEVKEQERLKAEMDANDAEWAKQSH